MQADRARRGGRAATGHRGTDHPHPREFIFGSSCFAILLLVVVKKVVAELRADLRRADRAIEGGIEQGRGGPGRGQAALEQYQAQLAEARAEAARIREDAKAQGAQIIAEMREQAAAEAARITETAHEQIDAERQQVVSRSCATEVGTLATDLAEPHRRRVAGRRGPSAAASSTASSPSSRRATSCA